MRKPFVVLTAAVALLAVAGPVAAQPAQLMYRHPDGSLRGSRLADVNDILRNCGVGGPADPAPLIPLVLTAGEEQQVLIAYLSQAEASVYFRAGPGAFLDRGTWCLASPQVVQALQRERTLPANRGPWLAFIGSFGFLTIMIGLVAMWGWGVGPLPTLAREEATEEAHAQAEPH